MTTRRGLMLVLSSPSGAGKTSIVSHLLQMDPDLKTSVSVTTRAKRPMEVDGKDYTFITTAEFLQRRDNGEFLEYAEVFGNWYGTPKQFVLDTLSQGTDVVFDIDWQGTQQINESCGDDLVRIFILPPSLGELARRLTDRNQDSTDSVKRRMDEAMSEMSHWPEYNYIVINHDLMESCRIVQSILLAERHKRKRQIGLAEFVNDMRSIK